MSLHTKQINGQDSSLLMLHGWGQSLKEMKPLGELLSRKATPHLIDLPGFGESPPPEKTWNAYDYADRIVQYLDEENIDKADILGHSFGGKVAMCLAIKHPNRINRLILLSPSGLKPKRTMINQCRIFSIRWIGKLTKLFMPNLFQNWFIPRFGSKDYQNAGPMKSILVRSVNEDLTHEIPKIRCETLILWGDRDEETPPEMGKRIHQLIQNSRLELFSQHGHQLHLDGGSHLCASKILPFLKSETIK